MIGAAKAREELSSDDLDQNIAYQYATIRNILYSKGYTTEMLINYEPSMQYFNEWWKQLYVNQKGRFQRYLSIKCELHNGYIPWDNMFKRAVVSYSRQWLGQPSKHDIKIEEGCR